MACTQSGIIGNTGVGDHRRRVAGVTGCTTCTNPAAVTNGSGQETEPQRKLRFVSFIKSLARGTNAALIYCAKSTTITDPNTGAVIELVARAVVEETPGHTNLWVYNGTGPMSSELQTAIQQAIDGYLDPATLAPVPGDGCSSGMRCDVVPMAETLVDVTLLLRRRPLAERGHHRCGASRCCRGDRQGAQQFLSAADQPGQCGVGRDGDNRR